MSTNPGFSPTPCLGSLKLAFRPIHIWSRELTWDLVLFCSILAKLLYAKACSPRVCLSLRNLGISFVSIICVLLLEGNYALVLARANAGLGSNLAIRQEKFQTGSVLVSQPSRVDERIRDIIVFNNIRSFDDYTGWLKQNIVYKKDKGKDIWSVPKVTLQRKNGDCEDFAFFNEAVLRVLGYQSRVIAVIRPFHSHALCIFKENGCYLIIDNNNLKRTQAKSMPEFAKYIFEKYRCSSICEINLKTKERNTLFEVADLSD